ncbi:MAG: E3 binding domain-containing protein [Thermovenabulum sp.]|uniref:E3 binding domain-containing protein n=1 Tax=Thermovenabulum sp. TaxID=3100335 RepID=UPI003C79C7F1
MDPQDTSNRPGDLRATPAARKLARELGIPLEAVPGTGPGGRITEEDVKKFAQRSDRADIKAKKGTTHSYPTFGRCEDVTEPARNCTVYIGT